MSDFHRQLRACMAALIDGTFGCLDAAATTINARWDHQTSISTLSRKMTGSLDWTVPDIVALEDAAGRYPVTGLLARRLSSRGAPLPASLITQAGLISREVGEAVQAILQADQSASAECDADALVQIDEAVEALRAARAKIEARGGTLRAVPA